MKEWPRNILEEIFGSSEEINETYSTEYVSFIITSVVLTMVPENVEMVIINHFKNGLTYKAIGEAMGKCHSYAQQLGSKGIRMLKHPGRIKYIKEAMEVTDPVANLYEKINENRSLEKEIHSLKQTLAISKELHPMLDEEIRRYKIDDYTLEEMDLSIHAFNCLRRSGISTVADLLNILKDNPKNILQVKNLGEKSFVEIVDKVNLLFGYNFSKEV